MMIAISRFRKLGDPTVLEILETSWVDLTTWLSTPPVRSFAGKFSEGGWSPAVYDPPVRRLGNVKVVSALVLDYDSGGGWDVIIAVWAGFDFVIYTTKSHAVGADRFRVVLRLARDVSVEEHGAIWRWAQDRSIVGGAVPDENAKDASRFWYAPTIPDKRDWRSSVGVGDCVDADTILRISAPAPLRPTAPHCNDTGSARVRRARAYLEKIPGAVAGSGGHTATYHAVCTAMFGFDLNESETLQLITEYNLRCDPPWSERELAHKIASAAKSSSRPRGYLLLPDQPTPCTTRPTDDWAKMLLLNTDRTPKKSYTNVAIYVALNPRYKNKWTLNEMTGASWFCDGPVDDELIHVIRSDVEREMGFSTGRDDVEAAIAAASSLSKFHPIRNYLRSCHWDGAPRIRAMAADYLGTTLPIHCEMVRRWMIGAVARALRPGCKLDTALMAVGAQGLGKSTFFAILGGAWHADSFLDLGDKDSYQQIHSAWIYELAELENVVHGRAESRLKAWLTSTSDTFRAPYARVATKRPRSVVLCGTTNRAQFLTDDTGSRRFWIVPVTKQIPRKALADNRDQLWAEAVAAYDAGEPWWLDSDLELDREASNEDYQDHDDPWIGIVAKHLAQCQETTTAEILTLALGIDTGRQTRADQTRVGRIVKSAGWQKKQVTRFGMRAWVYST